MLSAQAKKIQAHNRNKPVDMQTKHPANATPVIPFMDCPLLARSQQQANSLKECVFPAQTPNKTESLLRNCPSGLTDASIQALSATVSPIKRQITPTHSTDCCWTTRARKHGCSFAKTVSRQTLGKTASEPRKTKILELTENQLFVKKQSKKCNLVRKRSFWAFWDKKEQIH